MSGGLRVDGLLHLITPFPEVGDTFERLHGPVAWRNQLMKLLPRDSTDVVVSTE